MDGVRARLGGIKSRRDDLARKVSPTRGSQDRSFLPPPAQVPPAPPGRPPPSALTPGFCPSACPGLCHATTPPTLSYHPHTHQPLAHRIPSARSPISLQVRLNISTSQTPYSASPSDGWHEQMGCGLGVTVALLFFWCQHPDFDEEPPTPSPSNVWFGCG